MMADISLTGVLIVEAIAFAVPLVLGLAPTLHLPSVVLEIVAGIVIGPAILGLVEVDLPLQVLALLGLAFLLFLAGFEIDLDRLRGAQLRSATTGFVVSLAVALGIGLGLYAAGVLKLLDRDEMMTHTGFHTKLQAVGFGVFIPFFFITSGMQLDVRALLSGGAALALVGVFLLALLLARGLPAALYRPMVGDRRSLAAGLLQATSLPFIVAATEIGMELGILGPAVGAAMVVAGLLSVVLFPLAALTLLRGGEKPTPADEPDDLDHADHEPEPT
jgi:Kef-type K+ transport system membrane component KefB